jgi:hypothetical protein
MTVARVAARQVDAGIAGSPDGERILRENMVADQQQRGFAVRCPSGFPLGFALAALLAAALTLSGCATSIAEMPVAGPPADAPAAPNEPGTYLPVHDLPPDREEAVISPAERAKIAAELIHARDHQASAAPATKNNGAAKDKGAAKRKAVEGRAED